MRIPGIVLAEIRVVKTWIFFIPLAYFEFHDISYLFSDSVVIVRVKHVLCNASHSTLSRRFLPRDAL